MRWDGSWVSGRRTAAAGCSRWLNRSWRIRSRRNNAAYQLAWLKRIDRPIDLTCLDLGRAQVLGLPGEPFIEYQLAAQRLRKGAFVCVAGYGDGGPGYIPTDRAFLEGGYEPTVALAAPCEKQLLAALAKVLRAKGA